MEWISSHGLIKMRQRIGGFGLRFVVPAEIGALFRAIPSIPGQMGKLELKARVFQISAMALGLDQEDCHSARCEYRRIGAGVMRKLGLLHARPVPGALQL